MTVLTAAADLGRVDSPRRMPALCGAIGLGLLSACAPMENREGAQSFRGAVGAGSYESAAQIAGGMARDREGKPELLWSLNTGAAALYAANHPASVQALDDAESLMRASDVADFNWGSTYRFGSYDAVMVNAYKAAANLGRGDLQNARVELNRMEERQSRTTTRFQNEISAAGADSERQIREDGSKRQALQNAQSSPEVQEQLKALERWRHYQPFVNPAGTYLRAIYLLNSGEPGDAEQARTAFERVAGIAGNPRVVTEDMASARQAAAGRRPAPQVWVLFENGQSPTFEQMNFTVPMPVVARGGGMTVSPVTVSMPRMVFQPAAYPSMEVTGGNARASTVLVASMEGVMASEFRTRYNSLLAGAVFEALAKAAGVSAVNAATTRMNGGMAALLQVAATVAANVTSSDTRSWQILPRELQAARIPVPANGEILLRAGGVQATATVPTGRSSIVLVKAQTPGSPLTVQVLKL
ncbi:hypothetical protein [Roseomonas populi]|uniref:Tetratricopeptide repeat protein n=1 Tax=Roseomonas populi TaxID=3121582 RepID=A0ABT1WZR4_9PROT|nr:hypothetical protein [Roseomonas pecuniae]MCR0980964.1 hypothetical protein [Roseomonas pecuniae]